MMMRRILLLLCFISIVIIELNGQGLLCEESDPFCTGSVYNFPAGTSGSAQSGANYGCLSTQPAPAWYHMRIEDPGPISIYMFSTPLVDIDYCCWGPYIDPYIPCVEQLTGNKIVSCSYSPLEYETCYIPNGQTGEYYILLITNFSQDPCNITFSQTGGSGSTDCTILPPLVGNNGPLCVGETLQLNAASISNATYSWSGPNGFISALQNPVIANVTLANAGEYACIITINGQSSDPAITTVVINERPTAQLISDDTIICTGHPAFAIMNFTGAGPYSVLYSNGSELFTADNLNGMQDTIFLYPESPSTYTFTEVTDLHCDRELLNMDIFVDIYPVTSGSLSGAATICAGEPVQLTFNLTGTPPWSIAYTANGGNPQTVAANTSPYVITVFPLVTTTYDFTGLEDLNCAVEPDEQVVITVNPLPSANAGDDKSIPHGTTTVLEGMATGGSGNYQYLWAPAGKLVDPGVQQPTTINLTESVLFTLTVTDDQGGCIDADDILVTVTGGPLACFPSAHPPAICAGESSRLISLAAGGSGEYTYQWSSNPPGFSSTLPDPVVNPVENTTYTLLINDGYNVITGDATVNVHQLPVPEAGDDMVIPHGTSTILHGSAVNGSGNYAFHWEPEDKLVDPDVASPQTFNIYSSTLFTLDVTDLTHGCAASSPDQMTVMISGTALEVSPSISHNEICLGDSAQLFAVPGGGAGIYTYRWTSSGGFTSIDQNPWVSPVNPGSFFYTCVVSDGFNVVSGTVALNVLELPYIDFGFADTTVCVNDSVILDAGNPGSSYLWSNGSTERTIRVSTTGIGFDLQTHTVRVTNLSGCQAESSANITFNFTACSGSGGDREVHHCRIYPNPGNGNFNLLFSPGVKEAEVSVVSLLGQPVWGPFQFKDLAGNTDAEISLGNKPGGLYFIHIIYPDRVSDIFKYILEK